jgi:hypothetical protein
MPVAVSTELQTLVDGLLEDNDPRFILRAMHANFRDKAEKLMVVTRPTKETRSRIKYLRRLAQHCGDAALYCEMMIDPRISATSVLRFDDQPKD